MFLKYLIPFELFTIRSPLSSVAALQALQAVVEPKKMFRFGGGERPFEGTVAAGRFSLRRLIGYRNSFLPVVSGVVEPSIGGSTIRVVMRPSIFVIIFCTVWLTAVTSIGIGLLTSTPLNEISSHPLDLMPIGGVAFLLVLVNGGFWFEANKQRKMLINLFNGDLST